MDASCRQEFVSPAVSGNPGLGALLDGRGSGKLRVRNPSISSGTVTAFFLVTALRTAQLHLHFAKAMATLKTLAALNQCYFLLSS